MTPQDAALAVKVLYDADRYPWDEDKIASWGRQIALHDDVQAAVRASESMIRNDEPRDWSVARWREHYRLVVGPTKPELGPGGSGGPYVSYAEHLSWLAASDVPAHARELAAWPRFRGFGAP